MTYDLATRRKFEKHAQDNWASFKIQRQERLKAGRAEKVAELVVDNLLHNVLQWPIADIKPQVEYADIVLTSNGIKKLVIELKAPGTLAWNKVAAHKALDQALRYAANQKVGIVAITDGHMFYAADVTSGGINERLHVSLDSDEFPKDLWWISSDGIYRPRKGYIPVLTESGETETDGADVLHPKYKVPARCFAYVGDYNKTTSWHLPYKLENGQVDTKRLPKAIQAILTNYRGAKVKKIPRKAMGDVLKRLEQAAFKIGKMPTQNPKTSQTYHELEASLKQF